MLLDVPAMACGSAEPQRIVMADSLGMAHLGRTVFEATRFDEVWGRLIARYTEAADDAGALMDLATLVMMRGEVAKGLELQAEALRQCRFYRTVHGTGAGPKVLMFAAPGDLMANTPVDFLLEGSDAVLTVCYLDGGLPAPERTPEHDIAILAVGQTEDGSNLLDGLAAAVEAWPRPVVNGHSDRIAALSRDGVAERFAGHPQVVCPPTRRVGRETLAAVARGETSLSALHPHLAFPIIARPIGSHAGNGLEKIATAAELAAYLADQPAADLFVTSFIDYAGADGRFRKLRVMFVDGRPFIAHMAVSSRWMVHYLNADMGEAANRQDEAEMMAGFDTGFAARHAAAFEALTGAIGLDYFGIDCAETADGRLLVFEADVAMIVHALDSAELHPYKKPAMEKLFAAFVAALSSASQRRRLAA